VADFVPLTDDGRRFSEDYVVRLGDADERGLLRLDGVVGFLQDVATDDWTDTGIETDETWVVRRTRFRLVDGASWPRYLDHVRLTTWCGGVGAAWAERRTNIDLGGVTSIEAAGLWVPIGPAGAPVRLRASFFDVYGESARARKVPGRVETPALTEGATTRPWPLREADLDLAGHVNNAAVWQALSEVVHPPVRFVSVTHHHSLERDDDVVLASVPGMLWLVVDGVVKVSAAYEH
jgi:acyl-ACP thioesterase